MKGNELHPGIRLQLFLFAFIMLLEWLRPIEEVTKTSQIKYFIVFAAVTLAMHAFKRSWKIMIPILFLYIGMSLYMIFYRHQFYMSEDSWINAFFIDIKEGMLSVFSMDWQGLSPEFRTFLFFFLIWLFTFLIHYWVQVKQRLFLFLLMTFIYVSVLDTFTTYDSDHAIVRMVVIGFTILGTLALVRLLIGANIHYSHRTAIRWMIPLSSMIAFAVVIGFFAPKPQAIWPDPVSFIKSTSEKFGSIKKRIGYDQDDSKLGGNFVGDDGIVFRASSPVRTYWKIENKNVYTGKGWDAGPDYGISQTVLDSEPAMLYDYRGENTNEESMAELEFEIDHGHIPYPSPMAIDQIYNLNDDDEAAFTSVLYSGNTSEITPVFEGTDKQELKEVGIQFSSPTYDVDVLQKDQIEDINEMDIDLQMEQSLRLPANIPERVSILATDLAEKTGSNSIYDQVKAIEDYLTGDLFTYSKEGVPYPEENQDYVDQFLFDTQIGYCDNFSSAMVVLVRSLGIPARWVKGYTAGDLVYDQQLGESRYVITNNNAHSWPEVYFPSVGWVPFEPTKGFSSDVRFTTTQDISNDQAETEPTPETNKPENKEPEDKPTEKQDMASQFTFETIKDKVAQHWQKALMVGLLLGGAAVLLYRIRGKWVPYIWLVYYKRFRKVPNYSQAYMQLLRELNRYGIKRKPGQTLREYAIYVDHFFGSSDMNKLTREYEKYIYSNEKAELDWRSFKERWEKMILRTIA